MDYKIIASDMGVEVNKAFIESFYLQVDIFNLYSKATVKLKDVTKTLYNQIQTGMAIDIKFYDTNTGESYTNLMRVLSFKKVPASQSNLEDKIEVKLISSWYFEYQIGSGCYHGSFGEIAAKILAPYYPSFFKLNLSPTEDLPRYRYRIKETEQSFLQRMLKYSYKGKFPVYLYIDAKGYIVMKGVDDFISEKATCLLTTDLAEQSNSIPDSSRNLDQLRMTSYKIASNTEYSNSKTYSTFTVANFILPEGSDFDSDTELSNNENGNDQALALTPEKNVFMGWNVTPDDAKALAIRENFEANISTYYLVAIVPGWVFNKIELGGKLKVYLPYSTVQSTNSGKNVNLGEGEYIIKHIDYIYQDGLQRTKLYLIQFAY